MMFEICEKKNCTACYACVNSCPKDCIAMAEDADGALYPVIDSERCIHCDRCRRACPGLTPVEKTPPRNTYAAYSLDRANHTAATSGGVVTELCGRFLTDGGIVYASATDRALKTAFVRCDTAKGLAALRGSKYVHSHIHLQLRRLKEDLDAGKPVLFVGTPCQVAGLKGFLRDKAYPNLCTADIICHGVPTEKTFLSYSRALLKNRTVDRVSFRSGNDYELRYYAGEKLLLARPWKSDDYLTAFLEGNSFRENCYHCPYATNERVSDITLGDFWGIDKNGLDLDAVRHGINAVLVNTEKGAALFEKIKPAVFYAQRSTEEAVRGNDQLRHPCQKTDKATRFQRLCTKTSPAKALRRYNVKHTLACFVRRVIRRTPILKKYLSHI